ncbi:MAG: NAD(P)/FAD-dependent oxidoreductase [Bacillota bacterium]|nr:NAD(P)/FAD-dependent oxidoreductase [Bacillota bacterium]MDW7683142.1 NAD(P)/FAD-dependent oxidoreductase [Bacillota bacterium]
MSGRVAIIGAGPGGLSAAREAASLGLSVTIFEKAAVGEKINCAEGYFDMLKLLGPPLAGVLFKVSEIVLCVRDTFTIDCSKHHLWMIDRSRWQKALADDACRMGCRLYEHSPVTPEKFPQLEKEYDWIIDASGPSPVSRKIFSLPAGRSAVTAQYTLSGDFSDLYGKLKVTAEKQNCCYSWIFPRGKDSANVGVGYFGTRDSHKSIADTLKEIIKRENLQSYRVLRRAGGLLPVNRRKKVLIGKTMLAGDAAALSSPLHGGGIDNACISGILAARAIAAHKPAEYEKSLKKILGGRLNVEQKMLDAWEKLSLAELNEYLHTCFGSGIQTSNLSKLKLALTQEAAIVKYILGGQVRADWNKGIVTDGLPFTARILLRKLMTEEG